MNRSSLGERAFEHLRDRIVTGVLKADTFLSEVTLATDPLGFAAVENRVHIHDLHATVLHLQGFDHERLTFEHAGRNYRLTDVAGSVVQEIMLERRRPEMQLYSTR